MIALFYNLTILIILTIFRVCTTEVFTAMVDVESLLHAEKFVVNVIDQYIESEMSRLETLKKFSQDYQAKNEQTVKLGYDYISNPINSYLLIKRLTSDWDYVVTLMKNNMADAFLQNISSQREANKIKFPVEEDLNGAAIALMRLQDVYKLNAWDMSHGQIPNVKQADQLSALNCFELGVTAYKEEDFYHSLLWMQEAFNRTDHESPATVNQCLILDYLAYALNKQGNTIHALMTLQRVKQIDSNYEKIDEYIDAYKKTLGEQNIGNNILNDQEIPPIINERNKENYYEKYEELCRGEQNLSNENVSKLYCYYKKDKPFLRLAPLKAEIVHWKPKIVLFRQIISDAEIEILKQIATPRLDRSGVINKETGQGERANYRISKSAWIADNENPTMTRISRRQEDMTDLTMVSAEEFQVANYGLGGHYEPHYDFVFKENTEKSFGNLGMGNRIATLLTYLSTPEAGGATVFPELMLTLFPSKNDAVFWWNLLKNGEGDMTTLHAACPVLAGTKWVSNRWIHEYGQEFRRPCGLDENEYE